MKKDKFKGKFYIIGLIIVAVILVGVLLLKAWFSTTSEGNNTIEAEDTVNIKDNFDGVIDMPDSYENEANHKGSLAEISYETKLIDGSGETVKKTAMVYLPYNYDENNQYNIFYLMHGYGGNHETFLGSTLSPRPFKNVLDNMIENGDIAPTIVVTPEYTENYSDYYTQLEAMAGELTQDLAPTIESKYSTYAKSGSKDDLIASRTHRAVGGFSMGGCATWYTLMNYTDYFQFYLPTSMPIYYDDNGYIEAQSLQGAERIHNGITESALSDRDFFVFAASGDDDFMSDATKMQVEDLCQYDEFTYTDKSFADGNIMFHSWEGHKHSYKQSFDYFYNGLMKFFSLTG